MLTRFASLFGLCLLSACSLLQPKPEVVDTEGAEKPLPPALVEQYNRGLDLLQDKDDIAEANKHWQALTLRYPDYPGSWVNLAITQYRQQAFTESLASLDRALAIDAMFCPGFKLKGIVERELGKFKDAEQSYLSAIQCDPDDVDGYYNLGILYDLYLHDLSKALAQYQQAQALLPEKDENINVWIIDLKRRTSEQKRASAKIAGDSP